MAREALITMFLTLRQTAHMVVSDRINESILHKEVDSNHWALPSFDHCRYPKINFFVMMIPTSPILLEIICLAVNHHTISFQK